jgi:hypothetical protein
MSGRSILSLGVLALSLIGRPLAAQDSLYFGAQATVARPLGSLAGTDWMDGQSGAGAGVHVLLGLTPGQALMPRLDYTHFSKSESGVARTVRLYQLGADYDWSLFDDVESGPYLGLGLGLESGRFELSGQGYSASSTSTAGYLDGVAGLMVTAHVGAELRFIWSRFDPDLTAFAPRGYTGKLNLNAPTLNASLIFRL